MSIKKRTFTDENGREQTRYRVNAYNKYTGRTQWIGTYLRKKDAEMAFDEAKRLIRMGDVPQERKDIGFGDLLDRWFETLTVRDSTREEYTYSTRILRKYFKNRPVSGIRKQDIELFVAWAVKQDYKPRYVRKLKTRLSQVLGVAVDWGYLSANPAAGRIKNLPKEPRSRINPLEPDQVQHLLTAAPQYHRALFLVLVSTGLRRSEAFGLTWGAVDLEKGELHVRHQLQGGKLVDTKTGAGERTIPLATATIAALRVRQKVCPWTELDLVFTTENGKPLNPSNFYKRIWTPVKKAADLPPGTTLHQLRKTFASACASHGRTPAWLAEVMGHEDPRTTLGFYTGVMQKERKQAVEDMDDWLSLEARHPYLLPQVSDSSGESEVSHCSIAVARTQNVA